MKKYTIFIFIIISLVISQFAKAQETVYGKKFDGKDAITMADLENKMKDQKELENIKVKGEVKEVCQSMGCWMTFEKADGSTMRVRMKGHSFFLPKDCAGKTAIIQGKAVIEETSVEELQHYAEDAGKSTEEVNAIKDPKTELIFVAEGVILNK